MKKQAAEPSSSKGLWSIFSDTPLAPPEETPRLRPDQAKGRSVGKIRIEGLKRTHPRVVLRELLIEPGRPLDTEALETGTQRLRNLRIFSAANSFVIEGEEGKVDVLIYVTEKWTIIPVVRGGSGGGTDYFVLGAYDVNLFGKYLEFGAQYMNYGGTPSGVVWFRDPRFLDRRLKIGLDIWSLRRGYTIYENSGPEATANAGYVLDRFRLNLFAENEITDDLSLGTGFEVNIDRFSDDLLSAEYRELNFRNGFQLPLPARTVLGKLNAGFGRLNYNDYLVRGHTTALSYERTLQFAGSETEFNRLTLEHRHYWLPTDSTLNIGLRARLGYTDSRDAQHVFSIGGLESARGYLDGQFRGNSYGLGNLELRYSSIRGEWFVLQHVVFLDAGTFLDSAVAGNRRLFSSVGTGVRLICPRIYRLNLRFDYAAAIGEFRGSGMVFGFQQFF